jgi:hypothetical protein
MIVDSYPLVAAEYLAKGYKLSDSILQRAIHLDCEPGHCLLVIGILAKLLTFNVQLR